MYVPLCPCTSLRRWFILLRVLPTVFKDFAVQYLETHDFVPDEQPQPQQQAGKPEQRQW